jgi:cold shock CspA family protein
MSIAGKLVIAVLIAIVMTAIATVSLGGGTSTTPVLGALFLLATLAAVLLTHQPLTTAMQQGASQQTKASSASTAAQARNTHGTSGQTQRPGAARGQRPANTATGGPRHQGSVKWFNAAKGFGFITMDTGEEIFVHFRSIRGEGRRSLEDGQRVSFVVAETDKGPQAEDVDSAAGA